MSSLWFDSFFKYIGYSLKITPSFNSILINEN
jgi:hypothetical protein